jgi:hypothetical protein
VGIGTLTSRPSEAIAGLAEARPCGFVGVRLDGGQHYRTLDYFGRLVVASVGALLSAVVTAICIKYEERWLAWVWAAAFFGCALAAAYFLWKLL